MSKGKSSLNSWPQKKIMLVLLLSMFSLVSADQPQMFNLAKNLKELQKESSNLRNLETIQHHYQNGESEQAGKALKALTRDSGSFVQKSEEMKLTKGLDNKMLMDVDQKGGAVNIEDYSDSMVGDQIQPQIFDEVVNFSKEFAESLEDVDLSQYAEAYSKQKPNIPYKKTYRHERKPSSRNEFYQDARFDFTSFIKTSANSFDFNAAAGVYDGFTTNPTAKRIHKQTHLQRKGISLPKLSTFVSVRDYEKVIEKHRTRQEAMGTTCQANCDVSDRECNCKRLFECVKQLDEYDLAVLTAGGYIDTTPGSDHFGKIRVLENDLNLYSLDKDIDKKVKDLKTLVDEKNPSDSSACDTVLQSFHTACDPASEYCSSENQQSFQGMHNALTRCYNTGTKSRLTKYAKLSIQKPSSALKMKIINVSR
eukprot:scaffold5550_cov82-Cyclotella_meneghiniana.AAC.8